MPQPVSAISTLSLGSGEVRAQVGPSLLVIAVPSTEQVSGQG